MIYIAKSLRKLSISEQLGSLETEPRKDTYTLQKIIIAYYDVFLTGVSISTGTAVDSWATVELLPPITKLAIAYWKARFGVRGRLHWEGSTLALAVGYTAP